MRSAHGDQIVIVEEKYGDPSSNPGWTVCIHFALLHLYECKFSSLLIIEQTELRKATGLEAKKDKIQMKNNFNSLERLGDMSSPTPPHGQDMVQGQFLRRV